MFIPLLYLFLFSLADNALGAGIIFINEPQDSTVLPGRSIILHCKAELSTSVGSKAAKIEWRSLNDGQLASSQLVNGSLVVSNLFSEGHRQVEELQCVASIDNVGIAVSRVATIRRATIPKFLRQPSNITCFVGEVAQFSCLVKANIHIKVSWLKNGRPFILQESEESRMLISPSGSLEIEAVQPSDGGVYQCNVSMPGFFNLSDEAYLTVNMLPVDQGHLPVPPTFVSNPTNLVASRGENVTLDCAANGSPRPNIIWLKDGQDIDLDDLDSRFTKIGTGSLQIWDLDEKDEGHYVCRADNTVDSVDASATLQVQVPPKFTMLPKDVYAHSKDDVELECHVSGRPRPKVSWLKNGELIRPNGYIQIHNNNNLRIQGAITQDSGVFQCIASNNAGNIQSASLLNVSDVNIVDTSSDSSFLPSSPQTLEPITIGPRSVSLKWTAPSHARGEIIAYCIIYKSDGSERERVFNTTSHGQAIIEELQPNITYHFRVLAYNAKGAGESSPELSVRTEAEEHVPSPPLNLNIPFVSTTSLTITWEAPTITNGVIKHYTLYYLEEDTSVERHVITNKLSYELTGLSVYSLYTLWVVAHNSNGAGTSPEISVQTLSDRPSEPPSNVSVETSDSTSITVKWQPPPKKGQNGVITGYKLRYKRRDAKKDKSDTVTTAGDRRLYTITGLHKNSTYLVKIWAININGSGPSTDWFSIETFQNDLREDTVPDPPGPIKSRPGTNSIYISWTPPTDYSIKVRGYTVGWGKGVPDTYTKTLEDSRKTHFNITGLETNVDYVISLKAFNGMGDSIQQQALVRTKKESLIKSQKNLIPPMGLKALVLSASSIKISWIDTSAPDQFQYSSDDRHYLVRYVMSAASDPRYKYINSTGTSLVVTDLKPNTMYEFTVKVIKAKKESEWSMIVLNTTFEAPPASAPRDLTVVTRPDNPGLVNLNWQPPKSANGRISGYSIFFSNDNSSSQWFEESVVGDKMSTYIKGLETGRSYFFKVKAKNSAGDSPFSKVVSLTVPSEEIIGSGVISHTMILYAIIGCSIAFIVYVMALIIFLCCCRIKSSTERSKKGYIKGNTGKQISQPTQINPPDLWIHHDQMELKALEKSSQGSLDIAPSTQVQEYDPPKTHHSASTPSSNNSLDKHHRAFTTSYIGMSQQPSETRPLYPKTQYTSSSRAHVTVDASGVVDSTYVIRTGVEEAPVPPAPVNYTHPHTHPHSHPHSQSQLHNNSTDSSSSASKVKRQGHALKSFTVPAPPPTSSAPNTPMQKHIVTVRPQGSSSPYKSNHSGELSPIKPSYSTEELTQEMANLEGLMKDLDAITASEFKC